MTPQERKQLQQNYQRWQQMTPEQRERAREQFLRHRNEFEEKWRKEHPGEETPPLPGQTGASTNSPAPPVAGK